MKKEELTLYRDLLGDIKTRVRSAQHRAALSANAEMIAMYWDIGRMIAARQKEKGWGAGVIPRLAVDLKNELPEQKGFSERNLGHMIRFAREYGQPPILQQSAAKLGTAGQMRAQPAPQTGSEAILQRPAAKLATPIKSCNSLWHNCPCRSKFSSDSRGFTMSSSSRSSRSSHPLLVCPPSLEQGWTRDTLTAQIKSRLHERQGTAITNFDRTLPEPHAAIAQSLLKDPYLFDFFTLEEPFHERELETGLLQHIQKFLLELGRGFAFVGRQYRLEISDRDFYLDLLFYHLHLRCFVVIDLKKGEFKPEYAGKMNFYCSAVDDLLRHENDAPTIGLILCQTKDRIFAEYALRDIHKPIGLADYELTRALPSEIASSLPSIEDIESELSDPTKPPRSSPE
jgi:predicted nuclease of restriction endonuclease-like (RecB) superfamily